MVGHTYKELWHGGLWGAHMQQLRTGVSVVGHSYSRLEQGDLWWGTETAMSGQGLLCSKYTTSPSV